MPVTKHRDDQLFAGDVQFTGAAAFSGALSLSNPFGTKFYQDPTDGDDSFSGLSPTMAVKTLQQAIDLCTDDAGDVIIRRKGSEVVSAPVAFNKQGITVVSQDYGHPWRVKGESFTTYNTDNTGLSAAVITKSCRLVGLGFAAADVSEEDLLIDCQEAGGFSGGFVSLEYCRFSVGLGTIAAGIRTLGGALNHIYGCEFDGLFTGWGTAAIIMENDAALAPFFPRVESCRFPRLGSGKHAIVHAVGSLPVEVLYAHNYMGSEGAFLDNNNVVADGLVADNWLGGANQAAMFDNLTNSTMRIVDNHYNEA